MAKKVKKKKTQGKAAVQAKASAKALVKKTTAKASRDPTERVLVNFKVSREDKAKLQAKADRYCRGNLSRWMRRASLHFKPKAKTAEDRAAA